MENAGLGVGDGDGEGEGEGAGEAVADRFAMMGDRIPLAAAGSDVTEGSESSDLAESRFSTKSTSAFPAMAATDAVKAGLVKIILD
jgi:hypothetical protein